MKRSSVRGLAFVLAVLLLTPLVFAKGQMEGESASQPAKYTFAFVPGIATNPFYIAMHYGALEAARELNVELIWQGPQNWDFSEQTVIVESLLARGVDAMLISPCDPEALKAPLRLAANDSVLVITTDTDINDPDLQIRPLRISSDNYLGGKKAGEALAEALGGKGEVALMGAHVGVTTNEQRYAGFRDALSAFPEIKIVATEYSNEDQAKAAEQMESVLLAHPNLAGAFGVDTPTAHGAAIGLRNAGKGGEVVLVGFDAQPLEVEDLENGLISMLVAQAPYAMGYLAVQNAYNYLEGLIGKLPEEIITGFYIITPENVNNAETQKWIYQTEPPK
jgi:ribose transport system substrate-binding protein